VVTRSDELTGRAAQPLDRTERIVEAGLIKRVDGVRTALTFFVLALVFAAPEKLLSNPGVTYCSVALAALLAIWTLFFLDWEKAWAKGRLPLLGTALMLADVAWLCLLIYGTGGFYSPFESLLLLAILFSAVFLGNLPVAFLATTAIVALAHVGFAIVTMEGLALMWQLSGRLIGVLAVAWLAYGLSMILERERRANDSVVRNLTEGVLLVNNEQTIVLANPQIEKVSGLPSDVVVGMRIADIPQEPSYQTFLHIVYDVGTRAPVGAPVTRDVTVELPEPIDLRLITIPLGGSPRRPLGWVVVCQDVTDIKAVARMTEDGIAVLSHEIRSPLATLRAVSNVLSTLTNEMDDEQRQHVTGTIERQTERLLNLVGKLMDLSAIERGTYQLERNPLRVEDLISNVADLFAVTARSRDIALLSDCQPDLPELAADMDLLEQLFANLCENALKYTPAGGQVKLTARRQDDNIEIAVSDTGRGIPPDQIEAVFQKFAQADEAAEVPVVERGMGLGLHLCRTIVQLHGGTITVESTVGEGSTFRVLLPLHLDTATEGAEPTEPA